MVKFTLSLIVLFLAFESHSANSLYLVDPMRCHGVLPKGPQQGYKLALELTSVVATTDKRRPPLSLEVKLAYLKSHENLNDSTPMTPDMIWHTQSLKRVGNRVYSESFTNLGGQIELSIVKSNLFTDSLVGSWVANDSVKGPIEYKLTCTARTALPHQLTRLQTRP